MAPLVYDLTPMTKKADEGRRFVIGGFDIKKRTMIIGGLAFVPAAVVMGFLFPHIQMWALLSFPIIIGLAFWMFDGQSSQGMKLKNWRTLVDKSQNRSGKFFICGHEIDVSKSEITYLREFTAPVERAPEETEELFS